VKLADAGSGDGGCGGACDSDVERVRQTGCRASKAGVAYRCEKRLA
jgi:hypothetical protein